MRPWTACGPSGRIDWWTSRRRVVVGATSAAKNTAVVWVFFFQAEDGIRGVAVTGVQTCALPIYVPLFPLPGVEELSRSAEAGRQRLVDSARANTLSPTSWAARLTIEQAAAVNDDFRAHRPTRLVGSQIQHGFSHLVGRAEAPKRNARRDRKSTRLNSSHGYISYAVFCLKKQNTQQKCFIHTNLQLRKMHPSR